ncbi:ArgP/LysG family DNA-binding transcriptional regulator [Glutamicibacter sp.]|uniref:ArgP/LysG family DNA-binding transcriptional regulator n=1 Tax=Glutamicibacter sp. TaxID=1931995 RepID=UPI0028BDE99C|nr:ArgP/LysG family DNA-binding transcriptional regulator [Glutamicibacter sp.]
MNIDLEHLQTFLAVVDAGSFDDASIDLGVTASAVSQRIKALENKVGTVLLIRSRPVVPTQQGSRVLRYARQMTALGVEFARELSQLGHQRLSIGVNADSLATWLTPVFAELATWSDVSLEILRTDENISLELLRSGRVSAVVTNNADPAQGCTVRKLGSMRYFAAAGSDVADLYFASRGAPDFVHAPMVVFDREDPLQHQLLENLGMNPSGLQGRICMIPDSWQFVRAIQAGIGWGMVPEQQLRDVPELIKLNAQWHIDVPLYLQRWSLQSPLLERLEAILITAAQENGLDLLA